MAACGRGDRPYATAVDLTLACYERREAREFQMSRYG